MERLNKVLSKEFPENIPNIANDWQPLFESLDKNYKDYVTKHFLETYSGLMLDNTSSSREIEKVYCATFLSKEVVNKVIKSKTVKKETNVLIFVHHPMDWNQFGAGFVSLDKEDYEKLKKNKISIYLAHLTLDLHKRYSPSIQLAKILKIKRYKKLKNIDECIGIFFESPFKKFENLKRFIKRKLKIEKLQELKFYNYCKKIAVIPGGGDDVKFVNAAHRAGCDTYLTGILYFRGNKYSKVNNSKFLRRCKELKMNVIGASHYATEKFALREMTKYFKAHGLDSEFLEENEKLDLLNRKFGKQIK